MAGGERLGRISRNQLKDFTSKVDGLEAHHGIDIASDLGRETWYDIIDLHCDVMLQLIALGAAADDSARRQRLEVILGALLFLFVKTNALKSDSALGAHLAVVLIRKKSFNSYAHLLADWASDSVTATALEPKLRLMAHFSLIFSSCAQLTVSKQPLDLNDVTGTALYEAFAGALYETHLLEHLSRTLLLSLEKLHRAAEGPGGALATEQERYIRVGVTETCGCIVSALHGIAGKQGMLDSGLASTQGESELLTDTEKVAKRLMPHIRAVLSGPCLQFLLAREVIASRLRLTAGRGPHYGLPNHMLAELVDLDPAAPPQRTRAATDRLLSRLGAAGLVWHMTLPNFCLQALLQARQQQPDGGAAAAADLPEAPADVQPQAPMPYRSVNVFDLVLEGLGEVAGPETQVEHLPGGSKMMLVEPAMLLLRLVTRLTTRQLAAVMSAEMLPPGLQQLRTRLGRLWRVLTTLLRRPGVRLQYSEHRPLQLVGGLLRLDLWGASAGLQPQQHGAAAVAAAAALPEGLAGDASVCSFNLRCALNADFVPTVEQLLRRWGRSEDPEVRGETSCLCTVNHLLRWPCVWTALLAHGSVREVAALIITIRRVGETFKERGFRAMECAGNNDPNEHQDAEVVITAYMAALLEQQAVVLLQRDSNPDPDSEPPLALNYELESGGLLVFETAVSLHGGRPAVGSPAAEQQRKLAVFAVSQWLPNAVWLARVVDTWFSVSLGRAVLRWVLEAALQCLAARLRSEAERVASASQSQGSGPQRSVEASSSGCGAEKGGAEEGGAEEGGRSGIVDPSGSVEGPARDGGLVGLSGGPAHAAARAGSRCTMSYMAWLTFLLLGVDMLAWIRKYFGQLRELEVGGNDVDGEEATTEEDGEEAEGCAGLDPKQLQAAVLDVLEVLAVAVPNSVRMCIKAASPRSPSSGADATSAEWATAAAATVAFDPSQPDTSWSSCTLAQPKLERDIVLDDWLRQKLEEQGRGPLLALLNSWAQGSGGGGSCSGVGNGAAGLEELSSSAPFAAPTAGLQGSSAGRDLPELAVLLEKVSSKYDLVNLPELPSPLAGAEAVEAAGIRLCANPACANLEGDSEVELAGKKICRFCKAVSYCSSKCQLDHWRSRHAAECPGACKQPM